MQRFVLPGFIVGIAVALIALLAFGLSGQGENTSIDSQVARGHFPVAPDAHTALALLNGTGHESIADYRGKVVVLNIFASWCDPCKGEAPVIEHEQQQLAGKNATVLGVTYLDDAGSARNFMATYHISYPVIQDVDGTLVRSFGTDAVPETFVIDSTGHVTAVSRGSVTSQWLNQAVTRSEGNSA